MDLETERPAVEPVRQALVLALTDAARRAGEVPIGRLPGVLLEIQTLAETSRKMLAAVQGVALAELDGKEPEPVQPTGVLGLINGLTETVGTEVFQEALAIARTWLAGQTVGTGFPLYATNPADPVEATVALTPARLFHSDDMSARAWETCELNGWVVWPPKGMSPFVFQSALAKTYKDLADATRLLSSQKRPSPKIARELQVLGRELQAQAP